VDHDATLLEVVRHLYGRISKISAAQNVDVWIGRGADRADLGKTNEENRGKSN
jgi:hypothetical protein